jgi:hypothetical protein
VQCGWITKKRKSTREKMARKARSKENEGERKSSEAEPDDGGMEEYVRRMKVVRKGERRMAKRKGGKAHFTHRPKPSSPSQRRG